MVSGRRRSRVTRVVATAKPPRMNEANVGGAGGVFFQGVTKRFGDALALDDVSFVCPTGSLTALVGASGSGKTTLLRMVNRLVEPDAGRVLVNGRAVVDEPVEELRRRIGYVIQATGLLPHLTVAENIAIVPRLLGWSAAERAARVAELLELVALPAAFADRRPDALSGGQAQRVGVARALAARPRLLLMDEPFGALDPVTRDELGRATRALHDGQGLTTVMVTHDVTEALLLATHVAVLDAGRLVAHATPAELIAGHPDPRVATLLAVPRNQARRLAALV